MNPLADVKNHFPYNNGIRTVDPLTDRHFSANIRFWEGLATKKLREQPCSEPLAVDLCIGRNWRESVIIAVDAHRVNQPPDIRLRAPDALPNRLKTQALRA